LIFVTLGSQKFQFNRLLKEIDKLIENGSIDEEVFAQIGYSDYKPKNYKFKEFLNRDEFSDIMDKCDKVITHGGTGAIIGAVKKGKKVIAVPRLKKFGEHVDDHQVEILKQFENLGIICSCYDSNDLSSGLKKINEIELKSYQSNIEAILTSIDTFLNR
jgi:UDP-N-acetylglucosamine transferase subunit ALG13